MDELEMAYLENDVEAVNEAFYIDTDMKADWALRTIKGEYDEVDRLIALAKSRIEELEEEIEKLNLRKEQKTGYLKMKLNEYFGTVKKKETKTQLSYKLLSGDLVMKKPTQKIVHDDAKLIERYKDYPDVVEYTPKLKWAELKKDLTIQDGKVIDTVTGEVLTECQVEEVPQSFNIKFKEEN